MGIEGYFTSYIIASFVSSLFLLISCKLWKCFSLISFEKNTLIEMVKYCLPMVPNSISWWINNSLDKYIILFFLGQSVMGIYSIGYKIPSIVTLIVGIFNSAWIVSAVSDFGTEKSKDYHREVYNKYFSFITILSAVIIVSAKYTGLFLYRGDFYVAWKYVPALTLSVFFHGLATYHGAVFNSSKRTNHLFFSTLIGASINIIANIIFIPMFGPIAAAVTTAISFFSIYVYRAIAAKNIFNIGVNEKKTAIQIIMLMLMAILITIDGVVATIASLLFLILLLILNFKNIIKIVSQTLSLNQVKKRKKINE
jgi:O-antigen/teichoic acid export membrane protein